MAPLIHEVEGKSTDLTPHAALDGMALQTGQKFRRAARTASYTGCTSGIASSYVQANLIILSSRFAADFRRLCARNPVHCPLIAESASASP